MPRHTPQQELDLIESIVAAHPSGIPIAGIELEAINRQGQALHRRTLQRRLQKLIHARRVVAEGESVAVVYRCVVPAAPVNAYPSAPPSPPMGIAEQEPYVSVTPQGALVRDLVRRPLIHRRPVGYQRDFLAAYQPGTNFYLSEPLRRQLHDMGRTAASERPAGTYARDILGRLLVDLSWASSQLEGNTYSRLDTKNLIELGQAAPGKNAVETQMILNHKAAIEMLVEGGDDVGIDAFTFKNLHAVLSQDLMRDPHASGRLRRRTVEISGTVYLPLAVPQIIEDCFEQLLVKASRIPDPFEQAFFLMVHLPYLQPFEDVNKRVSRVGANIPLILHNLCPLSFVNVPERAYIEGTLGVYELNQVDLLRDVFVDAYAHSCQRYLAITHTMVAPDPLKMKYRETLIEAVQTVVKGLLPISPNAIAKIAPKAVDKADREAFQTMLTDALHQLHEGSVARYRLRRSEYAAWQQASAAQPSKNLA
jgi:hypothetical protein